ncbi:hypothetical protein ERJ75_000466800 [Trypanosoma vivax]|nr:hypothetical protein ERJ75_000466800 [Trypanosoma vivax]
MMTARATYLLAAALCCACAVAYGDKETSSSSSPETEPEASPPKSKSPESDNTTGVADPQEDETTPAAAQGAVRSRKREAARMTAVRIAVPAARGHLQPMTRRRTRGRTSMLTLVRTVPRRRAPGLRRMR